MKTNILITAVSVILMATIIGSIFYFESLRTPTQQDPLIVDNLKALTDGQITFNITGNDYESSTIQGVVINGEQYSWSNGSNENSTILKGETKQWSIDIGTINDDNEIQIVVEADAGSVSANTTVGASPTNTSTTTESNYVYDFSGGVGQISEGIHVIATRQDPRTLIGDYNNINDYWKMLIQTETTQATLQDFISIILSRGDKTSGGYTIQIENFAWLESYPIKFLFQVNFTDPGKGVATTDALTNPLVLVPIGKLTPGEYHIEVPIAQYVLNIDQDGNSSYAQILTFAPVFWKQTLIVRNTEEPNTSTTFEVILNGDEAPNLIVIVDLNDGIIEEEAKMISEIAFNQTLGDTLHRLDDIAFNNEQISAHYIWGYDENDMRHIFDLIVDITTLKIRINHCQ